MDLTAVAQHYRRVIIHNKPAWRPGDFYCATDTELLDAEIAPTPLTGLVQVRGTEVVYDLTPLPDAIYDYAEYHLMARFPFIRREKKSVPMQEAVKTGLVDIMHYPVRLSWQKTGNAPFTATLPVNKIEALN
jgi:hypothetical protein